MHTRYTHTTVHVLLCTDVVIIVNVKTHSHETVKYRFRMICLDDCLLYGIYLQIKKNTEFSDTQKILVVEYL